MILFTGDGGLWYHLSEIETALRWGVKVVVVVNDNHSMNEQIPFYEPMYGGTLHGDHEDLWVFREVDFAAVATVAGRRRPARDPSAGLRACSRAGARGGPPHGP